MADTPSPRPVLAEAAELLDDAAANCYAADRYYADAVQHDRLTATATRLRQVEQVLEGMPSPPVEPPAVDGLIEDDAARARDAAWNDYDRDCGAFVSALRTALHPTDSTEGGGNDV